MATRRKVGDTVDIDDVFPPTQSTQIRSIQVPEPAPEPVEYDDVTALNNVLAELGEDDAGGGFVTVFRETIDASGKKPDEYLERFPASEFSLDSLKSRWGAGKYKISVYQDGRILTRKVITIAKDPNATAPVAQTQAVADLSPILAAIQSSNEKMVAAIMTLAQGQQQKGPSRMEMMQEMAMMKEMFTPPASAQPANYNPIEMMKLGVEMANRGAGGGESDNAWVGKVIDQLGPVLMPAMASALASKQPAPIRSTTALPAPTPRPETVAEPQQPEENHVSLLITNYLGMLKTAAKKQADVGEYADSILSMVPASNVADIEALLRPDDWRDKVKQHTTAVEEYPIWFTALRDTLLQFIDEDRAEASGGVSTNLTSENESDSVVSHVNDNTGQSTGDEGDATGIA
jgi:hypothetical protein